MTHCIRSRGYCVVTTIAFASEFVTQVLESPRIPFQELGCVLLLVSFLRFIVLWFWGGLEAKSECVQIVFDSLHERLGFSVATRFLVEHHS